MRDSAMRLSNGTMAFDRRIAADTGELISKLRWSAGQHHGGAESVILDRAINRCILGCRQRGGIRLLIDGDPVVGFFQDLRNLSGRRDEYVHDDHVRTYVQHMLREHDRNCPAVRHDNVYAFHAHGDCRTTGEGACRSLAARVVRASVPERVCASCNMVRSTTVPCCDWCSDRPCTQHCEHCGAQSVRQPADDGWDDTDPEYDELACDNYEIIQTLSDRALEWATVVAMAADGRYTLVEHTGGGCDGGVDVYALGADGRETIVQVKSGDLAGCHVRELRGTSQDAERILVTRAGTTRWGRMAAGAGGRFDEEVTLVSGTDLALWLSANSVRLPGDGVIEELARSYDTVL